MNLKEIVESVRLNGIKEYDTDKHLTNTDEGKEMIVFSSRTINCRTVSSWGRDEDTDLFLGLDRNGWVKYIQVSECGAGKFKITSQNDITINDDDIVNYLNSDDCTNEEFIDFMKKACKYYNKF